MNFTGIDAVSLYNSLNEDVENALIGMRHGLADCGILAGVFQTSTCIGLRYIQCLPVRFLHDAFCVSTF